MTKKDIIDIMSVSEGHRIKRKEKDGDEWTDFIDAYESDWDNDADEVKGHSICVRSDDKINALVYDGEIDFILIIQ